MNARLAPLDAIFCERWERNRENASPEGLLYTRDGLHPSELGARLIAESMLREWNFT